LTGRGRAWTRSACAPSGGCLTGPNPTDRGKPGSKYHLLVSHRRLQVRYEQRADILLGFVHLACALICLKSLNQAKV
jgi:hypothetical protein